MKIISLAILPLYHPDHKQFEQGIINLAYCFCDDLLTILDHHQSSVDLI